MFFEPELEENNQNNNKIEEEPELEGDWESLGDELFYRKNKFEFEEKEKKHIKKMLLQSPPQLQHRRRVTLLIFIF
jgi:hypothetical protein